MPDWTEHLRRRLSGLRLSPVREAEIIEEPSQHLDQRYEELRNLGTSDDEARRHAIDELLEPDALATHMKSLRQAQVPEPIAAGAPAGSLAADLWQDLRYAARTMRKQPGFAAVAVLTLALGIGANSAIFALVDATLLRPLPFRDAERLVVIWERTANSPRSRVAPARLLDWSERSRTFEMMAGFFPGVGAMVMSGGDGVAETVSRQWVTASFFEVLGVKPIAGRTFLRSDDPGRSTVVVLSESFWRARFNADPSIVGRDIRLDGALYTVTGVVPKQFQLLGGTDLWALIPIQGAPPTMRSVYVFEVIGRLAPAVTLETAGADMTAVADNLAREFPKTDAGRGVALQPIHDALIGADLRRTSMLFLGVVAFVLLICCANVANILLARATVRARELAIRSALGASRRRLIRQLLMESALLSIVGGVTGLAVGAAILRAAPAVIPPGLLPAAVTLRVDMRLVAFCAATALLVGLLFGLAPAWRAASVSSAPVFAWDARTMTVRGGRIRRILVVAEVATSVVLLFGAGLLLRTLLALENVDPAYRAESVLTMLVDPLGSQYPTAESLLQFFDAVEREVKTAPGIGSVAWTSALPLAVSTGDRYSFEVIGDTLLEESQRPTADYQIVSPAYFATLDLPVVAGRGFNDADRRDSVAVCIVNEALVRDYLGGRSPIGLRLRVRRSGAAPAPPATREIVGVARQIKGRPEEPEDLVQIYVPMAQDTVDDIFMLVRPASGRAEALTPAVRAAIGRVDTEQLVGVRAVKTLEHVAAEATSRHRFRAVLVMMFAALAVLLAMAGVFGMLAYSVHQRVRDFGVRRALGATSKSVLGLVVWDAARVIATGAIIGLVLAATFSRLLATMLFGVQPLDAMTFAFVMIVLVVTAALSTAGPAWRATRIDPVVALRTD